MALCEDGFVFSHLEHERNENIWTVEQGKGKIKEKSRLAKSQNQATTMLRYSV